MTHDVFISYSSKDKPIADGICANLEASGIRCWIAPRDIAPGEDWPTAITKGISHSRIMVLVFSASSNSSEDVGRELILASQSKLVIIPFKIENIEPEPGKQYYLARMHWLDAMNPPTQEQINVLVTRVKLILPATIPDDIAKIEPAREKQPPPPPRPAPKESQPKFGILWIVAALIGLGMFACIVFIVTIWNLNLFNATSTPTQVAQLNETQPPTLTTQFNATGTPILITQTPLSTSPNIEFSTDFNDSSFDNTFDTADWSMPPDIALSSIKQENGAMVFSKLSAAGMESAILKTNQLWSLGEFGYFEARLKLDQEHTGENGNIAITLSDSGDWWAGCGIQAGAPTPFFWCGQSSSDPQQRGFDYMSGSYYLDYDKWYTAHIEFDSQTNEFNCFIDGKLFYSWQPANADDLLRKKFIVTIGTWTDNGTMITGYVDDVKVVK